ncbi:6733_t:CDS:2 [Funneliformis caledonium]|uniref:6733_t:CDS:1 n=1 Tax=Funneliformis caledonium TaxID=1117310 RepID=A0A9N9BCG4_9GLOM|nr:6733_t:CDS:2 [Funneliformis caledonium]
MSLLNFFKKTRDEVQLVSSDQDESSEVEYDISDNNLEHSSTETNNSSNEGVEKYIVSSPKNNKRKAKAPILSHHIRSKNFKISALSEHAGTKQHEKAFRLENQKRAMKTVTNNTINKAHQHIIQVMKLIFWLASENLPLHKLKSFINFSRFIGVPHIKASNDNGSMYDNHTISLEMLDAFAQIIENKIWQDLEACSAFKIMLDESTDIATELHVILYVKYCLHR